MYKVIYNDLVIDLLKEPKYFRYLAKAARTVLTDKSSAHGILNSGNNEKYLLKGKPRPAGKTWKEVTIEKISEEEFDKLSIEFNKNESKNIIADNSIIFATQKYKIEQFKTECNKIITNGIGLFLSDGKYHYFSLTVEDQLNLLEIERYIELGDTEFLYHENGKECVYYNLEDMTKIIETARNFKKYHTTYFNLMKISINEMLDVEKIEALKYGDEIPNTFYREKFKNIVKAV